MNQIFKKSSFAGGLILLFSAVFFTSVYKFLSSLQSLSSFLSIEQLPNLIVVILEIIFFAKVIKLYRAREPYVYFIICFLGALTFLAALGSLFGGATAGSTLPSLLFLAVLLFSAVSHYYQREQFFANVSYSEIKKNATTLFIASVAVALIGAIAGIKLISVNLGSPLLLLFSAVSILPFLYQWKKISAASIVGNFIFLSLFQIVVTELVVKLIFYWNLFPIV